MFLFYIDTNECTCYINIGKRRVVKMKKEYLVNLAGILLFYSIIVFGVIALNARVGNTGNTSNGISLSLSSVPVFPVIFKIERDLTSTP